MVDHVAQVRHDVLDVVNDLTPGESCLVAGILIPI